ncbi:MAG TPA: hypothetical protein PLL66_06750 [Bacteroidales bacterium]|nr:hypothetical protein [Bacteroidales bacterium]
MKILTYILLPIIVFIANQILFIIIPVVTFPMTWVIDKIERKFGYTAEDIYKLLYRFRIDMVINFILVGIISAYFTLHFTSKLKTNIELWYLILVFGILSLIHLSSWKSCNPKAYEFSLNIPPIIGFALGFIIYFY